MFLCAAGAALAHRPITTRITWNNEVSRILARSCMGCHAAGGTVFSLETYEEARAWATAIRDEVLEKRMPPWPPAAGFGDFVNDRSLTPFEIEMLVSWAEGGVPRGDDKDIPAAPPGRDTAAPASTGRRLAIDGVMSMASDARVVAIRAEAAEGAPVEVRAVRPDGSQGTLLWIRSFDPRYAATYRFREPVHLTRRTRIEVRGSPGARAVLTLSPASR